jgi:uncharacterized protein (DUF58 family)
MIFHSFFEKLSRHCRRWRPAGSMATRMPLVDAEGLRELARHAQSLPWSLLDFQRPAGHPLIGETRSLHRGRGFEFEENRVYQAGDEPRLLNWRLYARTGQLYTKIFTEERRPQAFLLLDRRAAMRFGTRRQLKVALACRIAACHAFQARQQALPVGGLVLNREADWFSPAMGEAAQQSFVDALVSACPPLPFAQDQPHMEECLRLLLHRLPSGCFVLLVSDFLDLDPVTAMPLLQQLAERHTVRAIQVLDPVEQALPASGDFLIEDERAAQALRIDGRDRLLQTLYRARVGERQSQLAAAFKSCAIPFTTCGTQDDLETCLGEPNDASHLH